MIEKSNRQYMEEIKSLRRQMAYLEQQKSELTDSIEQMKESEKLYRELAQNTPDWTFRLNADDRLLFISPSAKHITGYEPEDFKKDAKLLFKIIHPEDRSAFEDHLQFARKSKTSSEQEFRIIRKDRKNRWVSHVAQPIYDDEGQYAGVLSSNRDITDSKAKDEGSLESEIRYRLLAENINDVIWTLDPTLRPTYVTPSVLQLLGYSVEEALDQNLRVVLTPASLQKFNDAWSDHLLKDESAKKTRGQSLTLELEFRHKDGSIIWASSRFTAVRNNDKKIVEIICVCRENTGVIEARKNMLAQESTNRQTETRMRAMLDAVSDSIYLLDTEGRVLFVNQATARNLETTIDNLMAKGDLSEYWPPDVKVKRQQHFLNAQKTGKPVSFQDEVNGKIHITSAYPVAGDDGKVAAVAVFSQDVTDLRLAEASARENKRKLAESERLLNQIINVAPARIYWKDKHSVYLGCNRSFAKDAGREKPENLIGNTDGDLIWHDLAPQLQRDDMAVMSGKQARINCEEAQVTPDGETVWYNITKLPLTDVEGRIVGVIGAYENITEQKDLLEKLAHARKKFKDDAHQLNDCFKELDDRQRTLDETNEKLRDSEKALKDSKSRLIQMEKQLTDHQNRAESLEINLTKTQNLVQLRQTEAEDLQNRLSDTEKMLLDTQNQYKNKDRQLQESENQLFESEKRLCGLLEAATESLFLIDKEGKLLYANPTAASRLKMDLPALLAADSIFDLIPEDAAENLRRNAARVLQTGEAQRFEQEGSDGNLLHSIAPVFGPDGNVAQMAVFSMDVTDRKAAERNVAESSLHADEASRTFRQIINALPLRIFWKDINSVFQGANMLFARDMERQTPESIIGLTDFDLAPQQQAERYRQADSDVMTSGKPKINYEEILSTRDGKQLWLQTTKVPLTDFEGRITGVLGLYTDITDQKANQEELAESEKRYRSLFENNLMPMLLIDAEDEAILDANEAASHFYGWSRPELNKKKISDINTLSVNKINKIMKKALTRKSNHAFFTHRRADGSTRDVEVFSSLLQYHGRPVLYAMVYDISDRIQMEEALRKSENLDALGILAGGIAHDFNNLMTVVQGHIDVALLSLGEEETIQQSLQAAQDAVGKTRDLTARLLTFSKGGTPMMKTVRLSGLLRETLKTACESSPIEVSLDMAPDLWPADIDSAQIKQCFCHLADNAKDAMAQGGVLSVGAENILVSEADALPLVEGPYVKIVFTDNGPGISAESLPRIFDPYFTTKPMGKDKGLGLGLAVCHSVLNKHNGYITVHSKEGSGASFTLYLPAKPGAIVEEEPPAAEKAPVCRRILIMDDNADILKILQIYMDKLGFASIGVTEGQETLRQYREALEADNAFSAVFMEKSVKQGLGGEATLARLKTIDPNVKAVAIVSDYNETQVQSYLELGFADVLGKPFRLEDMKKILNRLLDA